MTSSKRPPSANGIRLAPASGMWPILWHLGGALMRFIAHGIVLSRGGIRAQRTAGTHPVQCNDVLTPYHAAAVDVPMLRSERAIGPTRSRGLFDARMRVKCKGCHLSIRPVQAISGTYTYLRTRAGQASNFSSTFLWALPSNPLSM